MNVLKGACIIGQSGGPTSVINASAYGVIDTALKSGVITRVLGAEHGIKGVLNDRLFDMGQEDPEELRLLKYTPSSALGSCRYKLADPAVDDTDFKRILEIFKKYDVRYFFYNGGNDSMDTCNKINQYMQSVGYECRVMGVPKTIDNDLAGTDHCPGFGSAARYAGEAACELALDASGLPIHVVVLELMGRNAGWVTAASALAARATNCEVLTYLPEKLVDEDRMLSNIESAWAKGKGLLVTVSEGICGLDGKPLASTGIVDGFGHMVPGGTAQHVTDSIIQKLNIKSRAEKPGLLGRAAIPYASRVDQLEAYAVGKKAVEAALAGQTDYMVAIDAHRGESYSFDLFLAPLEKVANVEKKFPLEWILEGNKIDDRFFDYAMPLMMDKMPDYAILR